MDSVLGDLGIIKTPWFLRPGCGKPIFETCIQEASHTHRVGLFVGPLLLLRLSMLARHSAFLGISPKFQVPTLNSHGANHTSDSACLIRSQLAGHRSDMRRLRRNSKAVAHKAKPTPKRDVMIAGCGVRFKLWGVRCGK